MIVIEGIIGVGKTTVSRSLKDFIRDSILFEEPVEGNPYLEKFYLNKSRWGLEMQFYLMAARYKMHLQGIKEEWYNGKISIYDRSIYGDLAFAHSLHKFGFIEDIGYKNYLLHRKTMESTLLYPQEVVFLDCSPATAMDRISKRDRTCEVEITEEYLSSLRDSYFEVVLPPLSKVTSVEVVDWKDGMTAVDLPFLRHRSNQFIVPCRFGPQLESGDSDGF